MNIDAIISNEQWRLHIGDPTGIGWIITIFYFLTFILCLWAGVAAQKSEKSKGTYESRRLLIGIAVLLLLLGFNKQLDFQELLSIIGRRVAKAQGWYSIRRSVQMTFIVLFTLIVLLSLAKWARWMKGRWHRYGLFFIGIVLILLFVIIQAAFTEHVFFMRTTRYHSGVYILLSILEPVGILLVAVRAFLSLHRIYEKKSRDYKFDWE